MINIRFTTFNGPAVVVDQIRQQLMAVCENYIGQANMTPATVDRMSSEMRDVLREYSHAADIQVTQDPDDPSRLNVSITPRVPLNMMQLRLEV